MADEATTDRDTAEGIRFAHTAEAEALPDDAERPCVYCNHDERVEERLYTAREKMQETVENASHYDQPLPEGVIAIAELPYENEGITITGHETNDATERVTYTTVTHGLVAGYLLADIADVPKRIGQVMADYVFTFGDGDSGASAEVPVCDSCLIDMPVEWADKSIHEAMPYQYQGDGEVTITVREDMSHGRTAVRRKPVDEQGNIIGGDDA